MVHALLVVVALGNRGRSRRNDADGLLVGLGVDDNQDACEGVDPGQDETLFGVMVGVGHGAGKVVVEDLDGIGEVDSVLAQVGPALSPVPLELDFHTAECMHTRPTMPDATKSGSRKRKQARNWLEGRIRRHAGLGGQTVTQKVPDISNVRRSGHLKPALTNTLI
jgi:hypothetical protein